MSQENVEIVRQVYAAAAGHDAATVMALYDPEVEWDNSIGLGGTSGGGVYRGHEGLRHFFREWREAWEYPEEVPEELFGRKVVVLRENVLDEIALLVSKPLSARPAGKVFAKFRLGGLGNLYGR